MNWIYIYIFLVFLCLGTVQIMTLMLSSKFMTSPRPDLVFFLSFVTKLLSFSIGLYHGTSSNQPKKAFKPFKWYIMLDEFCRKKQWRSVWFRIPYSTNYEHDGNTASHEYMKKNCTENPAPIFISVSIKPVTLCRFYNSLLFYYWNRPNHLPTSPSLQYCIWFINCLLYKRNVRA